MLLILTVFTYVGLIYYNLFKPKYGAATYRAFVKPTNEILANAMRNKYVLHSQRTHFNYDLHKFLYIDSLPVPSFYLYLLASACIFTSTQLDRGNEFAHCWAFLFYLDLVMSFRPTEAK